MSVTRTRPRLDVHGEVGVIAAEVLVRRGQLRVRLLTPIPALHRGFAPQPDDEIRPFCAGCGRTAKVHADFLPLCLEKQRAFTNPRYWVMGTAGALALATAVAGARRLRHGS